VARNLTAGPAAEPLVLVSTRGRLTLSLSASRRSGETLLLLQETAPLATAYGLTPREADVLRWLAKGKTNRDIAEILGMSPRTVNKHLEHIYVKLGVETRAAAAALAVRQGEAF
jgi:DNA-binding CsgD family transcriptional regulator